jgi:Rod binding domain-containing protein
MNSISPFPAVGSATTPESYAHRVAHAARQFEGVLLNTLLGSLEHSFASLPGKKADSIGDNYHSMGMQALASALADRGGVGIASMITRNLLRTKGQPPSGPASPTKVSSAYADEYR